MPGIAHRRTGPRIVERGVATSLECDVYDRDAQTQSTATAATVSIWIGDKQLVTDAAATTLGPPAAYTLTAATTADEALSELLLEVWSLTISGTSYTVKIGGYLVRHPFTPPFTQDDLIDRHRSLAKLRHPDDTNFASAVEKATSWVERQLIRRGLRPWQVVDAYALEDACEYRALHHVYQDARQGAGGQTYRELAREYRELAQAEMDGVRFRVDRDEDGLIESSDLDAGSAPILLTAGPVRGLGRWVDA